MSNYTKIQNWASLTGTAISGTPFDTEFASLAEVSATKTDKIVPAATNNLASLSGTGNLQDSGLLTSAVQDAMSFHYLTGDVRLSALLHEPTGWLYCDGGSHSTSTYSNLFAVIGYTYGGSGSSFNVPDLRGRSPAGLDNLGGSSANVNTDAAADSMGGVDGAESHVLTTDELAAHTHTGTTDSDGAHQHDIKYLTSSREVGGSGNCSRLDSSQSSTNTTHIQSAGAHTHTFTTASRGSSAAHDNVSPTLFMNYLIKT